MIRGMTYHPEFLSKEISHEKSSLTDKTKVSYIPVEHQQVVLRELFSREEAQAMLGTEELEKNELLKAAVKYVLRSKNEEE